MTRREYSEDRLAELGRALTPVLPLLEGEPLCVYATGSYGRMEAWSGSDVDLFFLHDGEPDNFPWTAFVRVTACLIEATERMGFPPFSGDGQYLEVLYASQMEKVLGSREDYSINAFTARMLLLLESRPVYDGDLYAQLLDRIVGFYYRDFDDHAEQFVPTILLNDILRFWRTLTLNYEHDRLKLRGLAGQELGERKAKSALKNYKLKVSRLATCFSMVGSLASEPIPVSKATVLDLCALTPRERFARLASRGDRAPELIAALDEHYDRFLEFTPRPEEELIELLSGDDARSQTLKEASGYAPLVFDLLEEIVPQDRKRVLVV